MTPITIDTWTSLLKRLSVDPKRANRHSEIDVDRARALEHAVTTLWSGEPLSQVKLGDATGLYLETLKPGGQASNFVAILEPKGKQQGLAQVLLRDSKRTAPTSDPAWILQAPHRFFDRETAPIAVKLFFQDDARNASALILNTKHRYAQPKGRRERQAFNPNDVAHNPTHPFQELTRAMLQLRPNTVLVQFHGFSDKSHTKLGSKKIRAVLSSGNREGSSPRVKRLATALSKHFGASIYRFPEDTDELGATTNVQGNLCRLQDGPEFIHIELSRAFRQALVDDAQTFAKFQDALLTSLSS